MKVKTCRKCGKIPSIGIRYDGHYFSHRAIVFCDCHREKGFVRFIAILRYNYWVWRTRKGKVN